MILGIIILIIIYYHLFIAVRTTRIYFTELFLNLLPSNKFSKNKPTPYGKSTVFIVILFYLPTAIGFIINTLVGKIIRRKVQNTAHHIITEDIFLLFDNRICRKRLVAISISERYNYHG